MSDIRRAQILEAALATFYRYGFRRVSMNDIAEAAGVSRPGLYLYFPGKESVFNEAIRHHGLRLMEDIRRGLDSRPDMAAKLLYAFEVWTIEKFDESRTSEEAREVIDATPRFAQEAHVALYREFDALLADIMISGNARFSHDKLDALQVARLLSSAMRGFKLVAADAGELRQMLEDLLTLALRP